jgi:FeS assembly SUF system protein
MSDFVFDKGEASEAESAFENPDMASEAAIPVTGDRSGLEGQVVSAIRTVYDPEIPINIYELGLIYRIEIAEEGKRVDVDMTLTAPGCPVAGILPGQVEHAIRGMMAEAEDVTVQVVWDPPWHKDMMSEAARLELGFF